MQPDTTTPPASTQTARWVVHDHRRDDEPQDCLTIYDERTGRLICEVPPHAAEHAPLLAAAPDLLAAIQQMLDTIAMGNDPRHWDPDKTVAWLEDLAAKAGGA